MTGEPRRLGLDVWFRDAQRIDGRVYDQDDTSALDRPFTGWLGLLSALAETAPRAPLARQTGEGRRCE